MANFDAAAAKAAGMTQAQIDAHIAKRAAEGVQLVVVNADPLNLARFGRRAADALPDVLGGIGGIPSGPLGYVGATAGGMIGEAGRQAVSGESMGPEDRIRQIVKSGGKQAAYQAGGGLLGRGARAVARPLMERALKVGPLAAGTTTPRMLRGYADTALEHGIPVGGRKQLGSELVIEKAQASGKKLGQLLDEAHRAGARIDPADIAEPILKTLDEITDQPLSGDDIGRVHEMVSTFFAEHPGPMTVLKVKKLKRSAQQLALPIIKGRKIRPGTNPRDALDARVNDAFATGAKRALENIPTRMPGSAASRTFGDAIAAREGITSRLLELAPAVSKAEKAMSRVVFKPSLMGFRPLGAMSPDFAFSRPDVSRVALGLGGSRGQSLVRQSPRSIDALIRQLMYEEPDTTGGVE